MGEQYLGEIRLFPFNFAPKDWALCNGQLFTISTNQALFAILGTTYGGNGITNFALPNLQGRSPVHPNSQYSLGTRAGQATTALTAGQLPSHTHLFMARNATANSVATSENALAAPQTEQIYGPATETVILNNSIAVAGQGVPYDNHQPYLVANYCIAIRGIFPSRN